MGLSRTLIRKIISGYLNSRTLVKKDNNEEHGILPIFQSNFYIL